MDAVDSSPGFRYPRIYKNSRLAQTVGCLAGSIFILLSIFGSYVAIFKFHPKPGLATSDLVVFANIFSCFFIGAAIIALARVKVVLYADAIEKHTFLGKSRITLSEIAGRNIMKFAGPISWGSVLTLIPKQKNRIRFILPTKLETDSILDTWLKSIPELDKQGR